MSMISNAPSMLSSPGGMFLGGGALIGVVVGLWGQIKIYASRFYGLFIDRINFHHTLASYVESHCIENMRRMWGDRRLYYGETHYIRKEKRRRIIALWNPLEESARIYWKGWRPVCLTTEDKTGLTVSFIRGTFRLEDFIVPALDMWNKQEMGERNSRYCVRRCSGTLAIRRNENNNHESSVDPTAEASPSANPRIHRPFGYNRFDIGEPVDNPIDRVAMTADQMDAVQEAKVWLASRDWFMSRGVPWKRGWLLKGAAGTGKTSTARAVAQHLDLPLFLFDIANMTNGDFQNAWDRAASQTPCVVLVEDIDAVFTGRENTVSSKHDVFGLTFDCLLNCVDGAINSDGILLMITTNHPEKLDSALSGQESDGMTTRPGRIDRSIEFGNLDLDGKKKIASRIFEGFPESAWIELINASPVSGAQFQERCTRRALKLFWEQEEERRRTGQVATFVEVDLDSDVNQPLNPLLVEYKETVEKNPGY